MRFVVAGGTGTVGRHVVQLAESRGHQVQSLSRATGADLFAGTGMVFTEVDAVIDVSGPRSRNALEFFDRSTSNLLHAAAEAGVPHHVALSIVGARAHPYGYYAGKSRQETLIEKGSVPWTILRATQFFEFAANNAIGFGPWALVAKMRSQPVSAESVARRLVDLAEAQPAGMVAEFAGPDVLWMADLARMVFETRGERRPVIELPLPGKFGRVLRNGGILPGKHAVIDTVSYENWLAAGAH